MMATFACRQLGVSLAGVLTGVLILGGGCRTRESWPRPDDMIQFRNHGPAAPIAQRSWGGPNTVIDRDGNALVLLPFLLPSNALLVINIDTGETEQFDVGFPDEGVRYLRYHILSRDGHRWYTTVGRTLREFDIDRREWTHVAEMPLGEGRRDGRGMLEDEEGRIWIAVSPTSELVSFDPRTRAFTHHGVLNDEDWSQLPDGLAMDDRGWIYSAIQHYRGNIIGYHVESGERRQMIEESTRRHAAGLSIFRAENGKVYARLRPPAADPTHPGPWYELHDGEAVVVEEPPSERAAFRSGWKDPRLFPDGRRRLADYSLIRKELLIEDVATGETRRVPFDYTVEGGANIYSICEGPDGLIYGSTGTPVLFFRLDPDTGRYDRIGGLAEHGGHINAKAVLGGRIYGAVYSSGSIIEYDPGRPWHDTDILESENPRHLYGYGPAVELYGRPRALVAHPDGVHLVMGGTPRRAIAGGGLLVFNTQTHEALEFAPDDVAPHQATTALAVLPTGDVIGGTTTASGSNGGGRAATEAEIYILDWAGRHVSFRTVPVPGADFIRDLLVLPDGRVLGVTGGASAVLFVFDSRTREIVHRAALPYGAPAGGQASRMLALGPDGMVYALFREAIVRIDPDTRKAVRLTSTPVRVSAGIVIRAGWLFFSDLHVSGRGGPELWSYRLPPPDWMPPSAPAIEIEGAQLLFEDAFDAHAEGPVTAARPIEPWSTRSLPSGTDPDKRIEIVRDADNRFGRGPENRFLRLRDVTEGTLSFLLEDGFEGADVLTLDFTLYEPNLGLPGSLGFRVGRGTVSREDIGNIVTIGGGRTSGGGRYAMERPVRVQIVFNNGDETIGYHRGRYRLEPGSFDLWIDGNREVLGGSNLHRYRGGITSLSLFYASGENAHELWIDDLRLKAGVPGF